MMRVRLASSTCMKVGLTWLAVCSFVYFFIVTASSKTKVEPKGDESSFSTIFDHRISDAQDVPKYSNMTSGITQNLSKESTPIPVEARLLGEDKNPFVEGLPVIYMITPTYRRAEQLPELTRTAQTLLHVKNLVWIVAEDSAKPTLEVLEYLAHSGLKYVYLRAPMPTKFAKDKRKPRGVSNRNAGIAWVRQNATEGVVYFGDDDNAYDLRIFEEIRYTRGVSMFPVGLVTKLGVSSPIVRNGKVIGFFDGWIAKRKFPVDMAGFAINVRLFKENPKAMMPYKVGYEETGILANLKISPSSIEPKAQNCTKIWVWHTQTRKNQPAKNIVLKDAMKGTNLDELRKQLWYAT